MMHKNLSTDLGVETFPSAHAALGAPTKPPCDKTPLC